MNLREAIEQLESCHFTCEGGDLEHNVAFIGLRNLAEVYPAIALPDKAGGA